MFLKTSISTTKKLFQKTLDSVKYIFSGGYQKIPKSPPCYAGGANTNFSQSYTELDKFYVHGDRHKKKKKKTITMSPPAKENEVRRKGNYHQVVGLKDDLKRKEIITYERKKKYQDPRREERSYLVAQKLQELKMLENYEDQHALDIEQVLYYYSRLTCPAYVEIVDKFFMEVYSELFNAS
ncbi:hypothetical protein FXO38_03965 [Capsicum annuum]|uniref:uncharacterized protein LOC107862995 n=1 Tax=Capsicum annuum TaxID=4072 RepID=UPI0007BEFB68|nr:uncharacterized protein LOC107862995 [Capsicum annuum]KAF3660769.1 hypothetical protein FXO37_13248 [Capsicum annuum]KAF3677161.1 hypothetical protein FXO38_03965 [Capsicum annuum]